MSIDGTYGRFSAHNHRFKELRRKKLERRENKVWRNSLNTIHSEEHEIDSKIISPEKLESIKIEIRKKAKAQLRKEFYISTLCLMLTCGIAYYFLFFR